MWNIFVFRKSCRLWDNVAKYGRAWQATDDNIIRHMRFACWVTKVTDTHLEYVIRVVFPWQQWLHERTSVLLYGTLPVLYKSRLNNHCITEWLISSRRWSQPQNIQQTNNWTCNTTLHLRTISKLQISVVPDHHGTCL